ncbi:hypothetical protein M436DRAFT_78115 [Aureobasidium namibiae CBS 147.97]|uniref:Transcription factor domain-containing protein n=1 Tax=Aureobasidium namibiae CBS 147.97 TaxID=1043004 RepID=A0A074WT34_9PEZI|nr:uncharacterized protein M436DRAFT_78115 [Aureobasidium namibiae CBS 147.97]KEQ76360.1 hypothetical protein M436DRAFT_78115 [Aureobasidium namibiae CBS 147.97]
MPLGTLHKLCIDAEAEEAVLNHSKGFKPLYHAICALSSLSLVLGGQQSFLIEAFQHYDWAISTCIGCAWAEPSSLFYLHFILLIYDICCVAQGIPDQDMWAQHLQHLARLMYCLRKDELDKTQAYILWYILYLDTQSSLAGNDEAGSCVRAHLANGSFLPSWTQLQYAHEDIDSQNDSGNSSTVHDLALFMCKQFAKLSQLALRMRKETKEGKSDVAMRQKCIEDFHYHLYSGWTRRYQVILVRTSSEARLWVDPLSRTMLDFALLQYSTTVIYLHTSMYPGQSLRLSPMRKWVAQHCSKILSLVSNQSLGQHHLSFPLFLAGYASKSIQEKVQAVKLMESMQAVGLSNGSLRSLALLKLIYAEQEARRGSLVKTEDVDWIGFSHEVGIKVVNFSL